MNAARRLSFPPMPVHIGKLIMAKLEESHMPKTTFAELIKRNRSSMYDIFDNPGCDTVLLHTISKVLRFNFFQVLSDDLEPRTSDTGAAEPQVKYQQPAKVRPMRIVIEVDPHDAGAKAIAVDVARSLKSSMEGPAPAPATKREYVKPRKKQVHVRKRK